ncbi:MAG: MATE family efflux transporter [Bacteroidota bacterium]
MNSNSLSLHKLWSTLKEAVKGGERDYTQIPLNQAIVFLAIPMVLEMVGESLFAVVDFFFVSQVGEAAMATVGLTESVMFLIYSLSIGLANAATAMVARRIGEKEPEQAAIAAAQAILISLAISIMIAIPGFLFAGNVLALMGAEADVLETGTGYTRIMFATNGVIMFLFLLNGVFRGTGNAAIAMRVLWLSNIINMILDPCLILGLGPFPELGVEGAAIATSIGRGTGVAFQLYLLFNGEKSIQLKASDFVPRWDIIKRLLGVAAGGTGQYLISSASWIFLTRIVAEFGTSVMAGYQSAIRSIIFAILPAFGLSNACATLVGQSLGAEQPDRAEKAAWRSSFYAMVYMVIVSILFFVGADWVIELFAESPAALDAGITCLRIISSGYIFFGFGLVLSMAFNGAGDTRTPTIINFLAFWIVQIPLAYFLATSLKMEQTGVYVAILIAEVVFTTICILWFRQGKWKKTMI